MFTVEDVILCYGQTQTVLFPYDFLTKVFGCYILEHPNDLGFPHFDLCPTAMQCLW